MRRGGVLVSALMALLAFVAPPSEAVQVSVDFSIAFDPPVGTTFANGTTLSGELQLFVATLGGSGAVPVAFGAAIPTDSIAPGVTFHPPDPIFPPDPIAPTQLLLFTFAGLVHPPDPALPTNPTFAYPPDPIVPDGPPAVPPFIALGSFTPGITALDASGPLFAFASPGTQVGTYNVTAEVVALPVPATLMLLVCVVAVVGAVRSRKRR